MLVVEENSFCWSAKANICRTRMRSRTASGRQCRIASAAPARTRFLSVEPLLEDVGELDLDGIHWVIVGGESGAGARPLDAAWVRSVRDQCVAAKVPFFFKQWGGVRKGLAGRLLDGRTWDEMPATAARTDASPQRRAVAG